VEASCAAPYFFQPVQGEGHEPLQDGGLVSNNPFTITWNEIRILENESRLPDVVATLGTGSFPAPPTAPKRFFRRLFHCFWQRMDGQQIWEEALRGLKRKEARRCYRLNPVFPLPEIALDDVQALTKMREMTNKQLEPGSVMSETALELCKALLCTSFYIEFRGEPAYDDSLGLYHCEFSILLRWQDDEEISHRFRQLLAGASYYINAVPYDFSMPFDASFKVASIDDILNVSLRTNVLGGTSGPISGIPASISSILRKQGRPSTRPCHRKRRMSLEEPARMMKPRLF
jgi:hypothetical protein